MSEEVTRSKRYTPEEITNGFFNYIKDCENHTEEFASAGKVVSINKELIPTPGGFRCYLTKNEKKISKRTWQNYVKGEGVYEPYLHPIKDITDYFEDVLTDALANGKGSAAGVIFTLKVNYGWTEKQIIEQNVTYKANLGDTIIFTPPEAGGNTHST